MSIQILRLPQTCKVCGTIFRPKRKSQKYCSKKCADIAQRRQKREYYYRQQKLINKLLKESQRDLNHSGNGKTHCIKSNLGTEAPSTDLRIVEDEKGQPRIKGALWLEEKMKHA